MIRYLIHRPTTDGKVYAVIAGLSTDTKPTDGLITGSRFVAADTGTGYMFDETAGQWHESQQFTDAVQAWLDDHPEAIDQAAIEAMFGDQLDGIEENVGGLKSAIEDLEAGSLSALDATAGQVPVADGLGSWAWGAQAGGMQTIQVSGTTPVITAVANTQYICGEVATLDITLPESGCIDVVFESDSTATVLTVTPPTGQTMHWPDWFDPTSLDANTRYEINIDNTYGVVGMWT